MRASRLTAIAIAVAMSGARTAGADGEVSLRGVYYKEKATRVEQPMVDARFDAGDSGSVDTHVLIDAITSASASSGADNKAFTEHRYEFGAGYTHRLDTMRIGALGRLSTEPDYDSLFGGAHVERDFFDKNFTLALTLGAGRDHVTNAGAQGAMTIGAISEHLTSELASLAATQVLSKNTVGSITYDLAHERGYLANPYRAATTLDGLVPERVPRARTRHAFAAIVRQYLPDTETTLIGSYRFYVDDWGVVAHTPELRAVQALGETVEIGAGFRYYRQSGADFYKPFYETADPMIEPYLTDDPKLSQFTGQTYTGRAAVLGRFLGLGGLWGEARAELVVEYVVQHNRFGNAGVAHVGLTVPFAY